MRIIQWILTLTLLLCCILALPKQGPVIGVYTQTVDEPSQKPQPASNLSYIAASYIKYIQMSGAQVVPILAYSNRSYFQNLLPKLNGVLFTGGDAPIDINNRWTQNADFILKYAMQQNDKGKVYPVWGTCLGMQLLTYLTNDYNYKAISPVTGQINVRKTVNILPGSSVFRGISSDLKYHLQNGMGILFYNHHFAVRKQYFQNSKKLSSFWEVEGYTTTSYQQTFIAAFRAKKYPFFGIQFHPEKNLYQWRVYADRSIYGAEITQILSNNFVDYARQNDNAFETEELRKSLIYNYQPIITPATSDLFQAYLFPQLTGSPQLSPETANNLQIE